MRHQCWSFAVPAVTVEFSFHLWVWEWCVVCLPRPNTRTESERWKPGSTVLLGFKAGLFWDAWSMIVAKIDTSHTERFLCAVTAKRQLRRRSRGIHLSLKSVVPVTFRFGTKRHTSNKKHDFFIHWISSFGLNFSVITLLPMVYFPLATTCYNRGLVGTS
jgi:hypothetical protein